MGIDAKEIGTVLWKILGSWLNSTLKFTRNHPVFSGVSVFLFTLSVFLPCVFYFLIYSSPVVACVVVFALEKLNSGRPGSQNTEDKRHSSSEPKKSGGERSVVRSNLMHQRSVRRNARMKVDKWDLQTSDDDDKDKVILTSLYNDLLGRTPHFVESPKAVETDVVDKEKEEASNGGDSSQSLRILGPSYSNLVVLDGEKSSVSSCETKEEEDKEVNDKEDGNEQKNGGNEPGISEIESQRLESLIARRKAKRLFKLASDQKHMMRGDETVKPIQNILQISVPKNNGSLLRNHRGIASEDFIGLEMPGSAPSVLLPTRNPFDIPYDPQEERPILKGDSFDLEFSVFNQKDMFFCRHESFRHSALFSQEPTQCKTSPDSASGGKHLDLGNDYENFPKNKQELPQEGEKDANATKMLEENDESIESGKSSNRVAKLNEETDSDKESDSDLSYSGESEPEFSALNQAVLREAIRQSMGNFSGFLVNQARNNIPSPLPRGVPPRFDDHYLFYARRGANAHTRTYSIASDLQVEVSEIGSPPTTVDWHDDSSNGGESYMYDTDIDREIACGEELRKRGSHQPESKLKSETKSNEQNDGPELDREAQTDEYKKQVVEEVTDQKFFDSSDASERANSGRFEHTLFRKTTSLSSIAEEPETPLDSIVGNQEIGKLVFEELMGQRPLSSLDSPIEKLGDDKATFQDTAQMENEEFRGSAETIDSEINDHTEKVKEEGKHHNFTEDADGERPNTLYNHRKNEDGLNNILGDDDIEVAQEYESNKINDRLNISEINQNLRCTEKENTSEGDTCSGMLDKSTDNIESEAIDRPEQEASREKEMKSVESTGEKAEGPTDIEETQNVISMYMNVLNISLGHPHTESVEGEPVDEKEPKFVDEKPEPMQHEETQNALNAYAGHLRIESLEKEVSTEKEQKLVRNAYQTAEEPRGQEGAQSVPGTSPGHPCTASDCTNVKNASEVIVLQVNGGNSPRPDESNEQEILKEGETSSFPENTDVESTRERKNREYPEEALVVSENTENSHGFVSVAESSEPWIEQGLVDSSGESSTAISTIITQQLEPGDISASGIVKDIVGHTQDLPGDEAVNGSSEFEKVAHDPTVEEQKEENLKPIEESGEGKEEDLGLK